MHVTPLHLSMRVVECVLHMRITKYWRRQAEVQAPVLLVAQLVLALAGNQQRSLRQLHRIWAANVGHGTHQVDLSAFALKHMGLMLGYRGHTVCAAALPSTLESLACCVLPLHEMPEEGGMNALLHNIWSHPCLARIHRRYNISLPPDTELWSGKHIVMTAEGAVWLHFDAGSEGGPGVFGDAVSVRIEAGTIDFWYGIRSRSGRSPTCYAQTRLARQS